MGALGSTELFQLFQHVNKKFEKSVARGVLLLFEVVHLQLWQRELHALLDFERVVVVQGHADFVVGRRVRVLVVVTNVACGCQRLARTAYQTKIFMWEFR